MISKSETLNFVKGLYLPACLSLCHFYCKEMFIYCLLDHGNVILTYTMGLSYKAIIFLKQSYFLYLKNMVLHLHQSMIVYSFARRLPIALNSSCLMPLGTILSDHFLILSNHLFCGLPILLLVSLVLIVFF